MWPWLWFMTPSTYFPWHGNINFPLSGSVTQDLSQTWFEKQIRNSPNAGDPIQEERIFEIASYGQQLGIITDILLDLAKADGVLLGSDAAKALDHLNVIHTKVEQIKQIYGPPKEKDNAKAPPPASAPPTPEKDADE